MRRRPVWVLIVASVASLMVALDALVVTTALPTIRVHLGASDGKCHEVLDGVEPGQEVVCGGTFAIKSELFR